MQAFINAIKVGCQKLNNYFLRKFTPDTIKNYKPFLIGLILDPTQKTSHFQQNGLLNHYSTIKQNIINLLQSEYER